MTTTHLMSCALMLLGIFVRNKHDCERLQIWLRSITVRISLSVSLLTDRWSQQLPLGNWVSVFRVKVEHGATTDMIYYDRRRPIHLMLPKRSRVGTASCPVTVLGEINIYMYILRCLGKPSRPFCVADFSPTTLPSSKFTPS